MRFAPAIFPVAFGSALLAACDDLFTLKPYQELASFQTEATLPEADAALERVARKHGVTLNREYNQRESHVPRDYLATILTRHCMVWAEKRGRVLKLSLSAVEGKACPAQMRTIFDETRRDLKRNSRLPDRAS